MVYSVRSDMSDVVDIIWPTCAIEENSANVVYFSPFPEFLEFPRRNLSTREESFPYELPRCAGVFLERRDEPFLPFELI